jgi:hypothetical protein
MKPKIAIGISGQTRRHNKYEDEFHSGLSTLFSSEFDYDLYAHTWDDQVLPTQTHRYQSITTTDQSLLWKYMKEQGNPFSAMVLTEQLQASPQYKSAMSGDSSLVQLMEDCIAGIYAQLLGCWHAFDSIKDPDQYCAFVRYRWDVTARLDPPKAEVVQRTFTPQLLNLIQSNSLRTTAIAQPMEHIEDIGDFCIVFTPPFYQKFIQTHIHNTIHNMTNHNRDIQLHTAHRLWENLITHLGADTVLMESNAMSFLGSDWNSVEKSNKALGY